MESCATDKDKVADSIVDNKSCQMCNKSLCNPYICPKCFIRYCSVDCYRNPSHIQCSEAFYKQCVTDKMTATQLDNEKDKRPDKVMGQLKKLQNETTERDINDGAFVDSDDEEEIDTLEDDEKKDEYLSKIIDCVKKTNLDDLDEGELDRNLTKIGVGIETESMISRLTEEERIQFENLYYEMESIGTNTNDSVFRMKKTHKH